MMEKIDKNSQLVYAVWVGDYVYVGSGKYERLSGNTSKLNRGVHGNKQLQQEYNKIKELKIEVLEYNITDDLISRELENMYVEHFNKIEGVIVCNIYPAVASKEYKRKLHEEDIVAIRELIQEDNLSNKEIAQIFNVNQSVISKIKTGKLWSSVGGAK